MYIQGLLLNEKESLIPNDCHCGETNCTGYDPNILVSTRKYCVIDANQKSFRAQWILNEMLLRIIYRYTLLIVTNKNFLATRTKQDSFSFSNIL